VRTVYLYTVVAICLTKARISLKTLGMKTLLFLLRQHTWNCSQDREISALSLLLLILFKFEVPICWFWIAFSERTTWVEADVLKQTVFEKMAADFQLKPLKSLSNCNVYNKYLAARVL